MAGLALIRTAIRGAPYPELQEGPTAQLARELFYDMNRRAQRAEDPGPPAEQPAAWPRLGEIAVPVLVMLGGLDAEEIQAIDEPAAGMIPGARLPAS